MRKSEDGKIPYFHANELLDFIFASLGYVHTSVTENIPKELGKHLGS